MSAPEPYWADEDVTLHLGDCLDVLRAMEDASVDAIVTDPPAGIAFMDREWDDFRRARNPADAGRDNVFGRTSARGPEYGRRDRRAFVDMLTERLAEAYRVLKPGGHALVWAIPRTSHWTAWAIEDAGFDIRDCILHLFGSGFPKSLNVSREIDKRRFGSADAAAFKSALAEAVVASGKTRQQINAECGFTMRFDVAYEKDPGCWGSSLPTVEQYDVICRVLGIDGDPEEMASLREWPRTRLERLYKVVGYEDRLNSPSGIVSAGRESSPVRREITAPGTEDAARWEGWGTALKPGQEMWWLVRKPLKNTVTANVLEFGTGALNIDACKVGSEQRVNNAGGMGSLQNVSRVEHGYRQHVVMPSGEASEVTGRWPTNIVFTHSAACEPLGVREVRSDSHHPATRGAGGLGTSGHVGQDGLAERKSGTETVEAWACAPDCPVGELDRQSGVLTSGTGAIKRTSAKGGAKSASIGAESRAEGTPMLCYGDTGGASRFYPTFRYQAKAPASERPRLDDGTAHETVKSLGLMTWMVKLITPPGGTVLDMFAGSGPVGEVCVIEGFRCVLIEQDPKSADLIKTRLSKPIQPAMFSFDEAS